MCLKVWQMWYTIRRKRKHNQYVAPFFIFKGIRATTYHLELSSNLEGIRLIFHVLMLFKYVLDKSYDMLQVPYWFKPSLYYKLKSITILYRQVKCLMSKKEPLTKVLWDSHRNKKVTYPLDFYMREKYLIPFGNVLCR